MKIIDGHAHVFETLKGFAARGELRAIGKGLARWSNGDVDAMIPEGYGDREFTGESLIRLMDENQIERAVLLQGSYYGFQNEYTAEVVSQYPDRFVGAATFDPFCKRAEELYQRLFGELGFRILKFETSTGGGLMGYHKDYPLDIGLEPWIGKTASAGHTLVLDIGSPGMSSFQPEAVRNIAQKYPEMKIVICHLLACHKQDEETLKQALEILTLPNVWFDLAAVPFNLMPERGPFKTSQRYVGIAKEIVGYNKLIWGTDAPSVLCHESYQDLLNYVFEIPGIKEEELSAILYQNARDVYF